MTTYALYRDAHRPLSPPRGVRAEGPGRGRPFLRRVRQVRGRFRRGAAPLPGLKRGVVPPGDTLDVASVFTFKFKVKAVKCN